MSRRCESIHSTALISRQPPTTVARSQILPRLTVMAWNTTFAHVLPSRRPRRLSRRRRGRRRRRKRFRSVLMSISLVGRTAPISTVSSTAAGHCCSSGAAIVRPPSRIDATNTTAARCATGMRCRRFPPPPSGTSPTSHQFSITVGNHSSTGLGATPSTSSILRAGHS